MTTLQVKGQKDRIYIVEVNGEKKELRQDEKIKVKDTKEVERLSNIKDTKGQLLFHIVGGVDNGENTEGRQ